MEVLLSSGGVNISSSSSCDSDSTTGNVMARRKMLGAERTPINLSHQILSRHLHNVGNKVEARTYGLGKKR
jgi:hypothetical protein